MIMSELLKMNMGEAIDWLLENQNDFEIVPCEPTVEMREAYHDAQERYEEECIGESPDSHWSAMIHTHRLQTLGKI